MHGFWNQTRLNYKAFSWCEMWKWEIQSPDASAHPFTARMRLDDELGKQNLYLLSINRIQNVEKKQLTHKTDTFSHTAAAVCLSLSLCLLLNGLLSLYVSSRHASFRFGGQRRLTQNHHVIFGGVERLVDPVHTARHVTGVAGDQHQVADWKEESSGPEGEE